MPTPTPVGSARFGSTFAFSLSNSFDVGPDPVSIFALGVISAGGGAVRANSITLNPGGTPIVMSAGTDRSLGELGASGRVRKFDAVATGLTGVVNFTLACTDLSGVADNNGKPGVSFWWWKDVVSSTDTTIPGAGVSGGSTFTSPAVSSAAGQVVMGIALTDGNPAGFAGIGGTVLDGAGFAGDYQHALMYEAGAASTSLQLSVASTAGFMGHMWNLVGSAPSDLTFNANMDAFTSGLALAQFIPSLLTFNANMDAFVSGIALAQAPGVINFGPLKNGSNFRWDRSDITAVIKDRTTEAVLATLTGVTSGPSGGSLTSTAIVSGGLYRVTFKIPAGGILPIGAKGDADLAGA